jgi:2-methylisocitrate lyase-like PEP mutase family enzyme
VENGRRYDIAMTNQKQSAVVDRFRKLHASGCFVIPNPWDAGSAIYLEQLGFEALATTSAGFAFSRGLTDATGVVTLDMMLSHFAEIAAATNVPVNADFQNGGARQPDDVAENVKLCIATGVAGLSIEDSTGDSAQPLYDFALAVDRIKAARAAINDSGTPVVLTGRCEAWLVGEPDPRSTALKRLVAYAEAGADCLYAPGGSDPEDIAAIVAAVAPKPVNVLVSSGNADMTVAQLADLGVRRISVGGALARVAWGAFMRSAKTIKEAGTFTDFKDAAPFDEIQKLFAARSK